MPDDAGAVLLGAAAAFTVDELAQAIAAELTKAVVPGLGTLPAGATTTDLAARARALTQQQQGTGGFEALPREELSPFGPGMPLLPSSIDPRLPSGRTEPRLTQFPIAWNLMVTGDRTVPFETLRKVARQVDVIRRCIEVRKAQLVSLEWDITMTPAAIKAVMAEQGEMSPGKAAKIARERYAEDITRVREFWETPDQLNNYDFPTWLNLLMEEQLVIDAISVYPRQTLGGQLHSFEVLDGSTIKPLFDHRGGVPRPPMPAYQQILYGFPRGEFVSSIAGVSEEFTRDRLIYWPRFADTTSPYGFSNVEQALTAANLYLKRMGWIRSEFDEGALPDTFVKTDMKIADPQQLLIWEQILNDALAGDDAARHALKFLPDGFVPEQMTNMAEKFNPDLDELFIKICCMCFDVMPTEIGFPPKSGIGGKGHQEGEESSSYRKGVRPTVVWLRSFLSNISRTYLAMPKWLQFSFLGYEQEDQSQLEEMADKRCRGGRSTINDERAARGQPLWDFPEADSPFVVTGSGLVFLDGALAAQANGTTETAPDAAETAPADDVPPASATDPRTAELAKFSAFVNRAFDGTRKWRPFAFTAVHSELAELLNGWGELAALGDATALDEIKALAGQEVAA